MCLIYPYIPSYTLINPYIPPYTLIYPHIPLFTLTYHHMGLIHPHILSFTLIYPHIPSYTLIYTHIPSHGPHIASYTLIYPHIPSYGPHIPSKLPNGTICCQKVGTGTKCRPWRTPPGQNVAPMKTHDHLQNEFKSDILSRDNICPGTKCRGTKCLLTALSVFWWCFPRGREPPWWRSSISSFHILVFHWGEDD